MRLIITAKASVARVVAEALSTQSRSCERGEGYFLSGPDVITWCGGHLLELAEPEAYDASYHHWRLEDLPIIPDIDSASAKTWKVKERGKGHEQLEVIRHFLSEADEVVHAGDPDREGQWMIDEVLQYLDNRLPVKRLLIQDLNYLSVRKALGSMRDNVEFIHLSESAMARSRADWLYGINMTRAYTLLGRHSGYEGVLTVGRVQTPVLALVVKRDEAVEQFKAQHYFEISLKIAHEKANGFCQAKLKNYPENEFIHDNDACEALVKKVQGKSGMVLSCVDRKISVSPPLPFNLSALQIECSKLFGYSAKETQDICVQLYEKYHLITYPRSDCRYLPEEYFDKAGEVLEAITFMLGDESPLSEKIKKSDCWIKQAVWNDKKIKAHHGIIPTTKQGEFGLLSEQEKQVYSLIAAYYVAQFYLDHQYLHRDIVFFVVGQECCVSGKQILESGWCEVIPAENDCSDEPAGVSLPGLWLAWQQGESIRCDDVSIREKMTRPPARFTDVTLMEAMENISDHVENMDVKCLLKAGDGLGTEATRAFIVDGLFKREFLMKGNKNIFSTAIGRDLIHAMPNHSEQIDLTALWEKNLSDIAEGTLAYKKFMGDLQGRLVELIAYVREKKTMTVTSADEVLGLKTGEKFYCQKCRSLLMQRNGKYGFFWGCSGYPECKTTYPDLVGKDGHHRPKIIL